MLEKSRPLTPNISREESMGSISLENNKEIRILRTNKGNCMLVLHEFTYKEKLSSLLESGVYEIPREDPASQIERMMLSRNKIVLPIALKHKLSPYHSKPPYLHGLPKKRNLTSHSDY
jgi:hypothetical protein